MKKILSIALFGFFIFNGFEVGALSIERPWPESPQRSYAEELEYYDYVYLFRIISVDIKKEILDECYGRITEEAQVEVLAIYKGNIEEISGIKNVSRQFRCITRACDTNILSQYSLESCDRPHTWLSEGGIMANFSDNPNELGGLSFYMLPPPRTDASCRRDEWFIKDLDEPIWVREPIEI